MVAISSMTGFARGEGGAGALTWSWEAKSVNGKGLDLRCRLPQGTGGLEIEARALAQKTFKRGNITLSLTLGRADDGAPRFRVNREFLDQVVQTVRELEGEIQGIETPRLDGLLGLRGVIEIDDGDAPLNGADPARLLESLATVLADLTAMRDAEGTRIAEVLAGQLDAIARLTEAADGLAEMQPAAIRARLAAQIAELMEDRPGLSEERLAHEAALLMTKADVREELDRLGAHMEAARALMAEGGAIGRRLDFLCQEFNREANTLCSKAADVELTRIGLELKATIEQFREQVQNIE